MAIVYHRLPVPCCTWCGDKPHDGPCPRTDCPCAYRKPTDPQKGA